MYFSVCILHVNKVFFPLMYFYSISLVNIQSDTLLIVLQNDLLLIASPPELVFFKLKEKISIHRGILSIVYT